MDGLNDDEIITKMFIGLSQEQFWYQDIINFKFVANNLLRQIKLLIDIPKEINSSIEPENIFHTEIGIKLKSFIKILLVLVNFGFKDIKLPCIQVNNDLIKIDEDLSADNFNQIIELYTGDYSYYWNSTVQHFSLFIKPIIRTKRTNELIISNIFLLIRKIYDGAFWILRDIFFNKQNGSREFTSEYGRYYEKYIENLLNFYLKKDQFERIEEVENNKRADWIIYTQEYILLIEQKSSLMSIMLKKEYPDLEQIDNYTSND